MWSTDTEFTLNVDTWLGVCAIRRKRQRTMIAEWTCPIRIGRVECREWTSSRWSTVCRSTRAVLMDADRWSQRVRRAVDSVLFGAGRGSAATDRFSEVGELPRRDDCQEHLTEVKNTPPR